MAVATLCKLGQWQSSSDAFVAHPASPTGAVFDLNDGVIFSLVDPGSTGTALQWSPVAQHVFDMQNPHQVGARVVRIEHIDNRTLTLRLVCGMGTSYATWSANVHILQVLLAGITENQPAALLIQPTGASTPTYADVVAAKKVQVPYNELKWAQLIEDEIEIEFAVKPFLRGARQTLSNLCYNPGFENPSGTAVTVMNDTFANFDAYVPTNAGYISAVTTDAPVSFWHMAEPAGATVMADSTGIYLTTVNADSPVSFWHMAELSGSTMTDSADSNPGTIYSGVTIGNNGFNNQANFGSYSFPGSSTGKVQVLYAANINTTNWTVEAWVQPTGGAGTIRTIMANGVSNNTGIDLFITSGNAFGVSVGTGSGSTSINGGTATLNSWAHVVATYNGTTLTLYVNGASVASAATAFSANTTVDWWLGSTPGGSQFLPGLMSAVAIYNTALTGTRITAHYNAGFSNNGIVYAGVTTGGVPPSSMPNLGSYNFPGSSTSKVQVLYASTLNTASWSIEAWVQPTGGAGTIRTIMDCATGNTGIDLWVTSGNAYAVQIGTGSSTASINGGTATLNTWAHVVATYNGTTLTLYVNGASVATTTTSFGQNTTVDWWFGSTPGGGQYWIGTESAVAIYNTALSSARVLAHYNAGNLLYQDKTYFPDTLNTIVGSNGGFYFRLDEASGTTAYDAYANANGTYGAGATLAATGLLTGDGDTAITVAGTSTGNVTRAGTALSTGNSSWSYGGWFKITANPGAVTMLSVGTNTSKEGVYISFNSSNQFQGGVIGTNILGSTVSLNTPHMYLITWDGTNLKLYLDGSQVGSTQTPGSLTMTLGSTAVYIGNFFGASGYFSGTLDDTFGVPFAMSATHATNMYNAGTTTPAVASNTMVIAASTAVACGSPAWGGKNGYQLRFRYLGGATIGIYLNAQDGNNYSGFQITGTQLAIVDNVAGGGLSTLQTAAIHLVSGCYYWIQATVWPGTAGGPTSVSATLLTDAAGSVGGTTIGSVATTGALSAPIFWTGNIRLAVTGAAVGLGGNYANVHLVQLFGPGSWSFSSTGAALCTGAWQSGQGVSGTGIPYVGTAVARIDAPPGGGAWAGTWYGYQTTSTPAEYLIPTPGAIPGVLSASMGVSVWVKTSGLTSAASLIVYLNCYNASGVYQAAQFVGIVSGNQPGWTQISGTVTVPNTYPYVALQCTAGDTSVNSSGAWVLWDNAQVWSVTATGQSTMPWCDFRNLQSPFQWVATGIQGDILTPASVAFGTYEASWAANAVLNLYCGRRLFPASSGSLVQQYTPATSTANALDTTAWGGFTVPGFGLSTTSGEVLGTGNAAFPTLSQAQGAYRVLQRLKSSQSTGNIANVTGFLDTIEAPIGTGALSDVTTTTVQPFTAGSTWTTTDWGRIAFPLAPLAASRDLTQIVPNVTTYMADTTGGGSTITANWYALVPTDTEFLTAQAANGASGATLSNSWLFFYGDGTIPQQAGWFFSSESTSVPNVKHAVAGFGSNGAGLRSTAATYLQLDPGYTIGGTSVATGVALITDASATVLPCVLEMTYSPLYYIPK